jgi:hypothetical protein
LTAKRKINMVFNYLQKKGFDKALLKSVHAPIGLEINYEMPQGDCLKHRRRVGKIERREAGVEDPSILSWADYE